MSPVTWSITTQPLPESGQETVLLRRQWRPMAQRWLSRVHPRRTGTARIRHADIDSIACAGRPRAEAGVRRPRTSVRQGSSVQAGVGPRSRVCSGSSGVRRVGTSIRSPVPSGVRTCIDYRSSIRGSRPGIQARVEGTTASLLQQAPPHCTEPEGHDVAQWLVRSQTNPLGH